MQSRKICSQTGALWLRRHWGPVAIAAVTIIASLLFLAGQPLLAADAQPRIGQTPGGTVPPPTPTRDVPKPGNDDNRSGNNNSSAATTPTVEQPAGPVVETAAITSTGALTAVVDVLTLNARQGPGTSFPVIGKLTQGTVVAVEAANTAGDWWLICCVPATQTRGWVSAALVVPSFAADQSAALPVSDSTVEAAPLGAATGVTTTAAATTTAATLVPGAPTGTVAGVNLNVRGGPSTDNPVIAKLRANDVVSVLGRNAGGDWLYICCVGSPAGNGWVSAQFITPAFTTAELEEVAGVSTTAPAAAGGTTESAGSTTGSTATASTGTGGLSLTVAQQPPFAVQGREIALVYTVRNDTTSDLADVMLRSELPGPLTLVGASAGGGQVASQDAAQNPSSVEITFPVLAAGQAATATVRVRVADDVPNGTTFNNFATVTGGAETASTGITIGMPPSLLPEFW